MHGMHSLENPRKSSTNTLNFSPEILEKILCALFQSFRNFIHKFIQKVVRYIFNVSKDIFSGVDIHLVIDLKIAS